MVSTIDIGSYLKLYRVLRASIYLSTTDMKILGIAHESGYNSVSSFFADLKKVFGLSPVRFRKRHGGRRRPPRYRGSRGP